MKDKIYRVVLNTQSGKMVLEPLNEIDILAIAREIRTKKAENSAGRTK
jgi:hypothetical protein